jgi:hypothetical protein
MGTDQFTLPVILSETKDPAAWRLALIMLDSSLRSE